MPKTTRFCKGFSRTPLALKNSPPSLCARNRVALLHSQLNAISFTITVSAYTLDAKKRAATSHSFFRNRLQQWRHCVLKYKEAST